MSNLGHGKHGLFQRSITLSLVALLTIVPAASFAGPADATAIPAVGVLSVDSDPPGAAVYVDGRFAGQTPLNVTRLATGDHRVRVVKDGFLENGRTVSVNAKQAAAVQVKLTRNTTANVDTASQATGATGGSGGGSKKWIIIGAAAGGGVLAAVLLSKKNKAPSTPNISAPTTQGLASSTSFSFTASATDPDGDSLSFTWDFGDGSTGTGSQVTHTYASAGSFNVTVKADDGKGNSVTSGATAVTVRSMAGAWSGTFGSFAFTMNLTQNGTTIGGSYNDSDGPGAVSGVVSAGNSVRITVTQGAFLPFTFAGTTDAGVANVSGSVTGLVSAATFTMRR